MVSTLKRADWLLRQKICLLLKIEADENDGIFPLEAAPIHLMVCKCTSIKGSTGLPTYRCDPSTKKKLFLREVLI